MPKVVSERFLTLAEVVEILEEVQRKRDLSSIEAYTLDYAKKFSRLDPESAKQAVAELVELGVPEHTAVQIVNIMPRCEDELRIILAPLMKAFTSDKIKRMLEIIEKYRKEE